jgi:hypothetical protein
MAEDSANTAHSAARAMLDAFASVGATSFDVTWTTTQGKPRRFDEGVSLADLARRIPDELDKATRQQRNLIVRPEGLGVTFMQLDDLTADRMQRLAPAVFLTLETSPGNFQAWLAMPGDEDKDFTRRVKKGSGADATASGATRVAGSLNFKEKYAPAFPRVAIHTAAPGRKVTAAELEQLGLVAPPEKLPPLRVTPARAIPGSNRRWPDYGRCLDGAPLNSEGTGPDTSRADFVFCMTAYTWGFSVADIAKQLMEEPDSKAHERGQDYADLTAKNAALAVERRKGKPSGRIATYERG